MWLINTSTYRLEHFIDHTVVKYAILSHTWGDNELLFQDISGPDGAERARNNVKVRYTCEQAKKDGLHYAWIDTCSIDKRSSAELSEGINSMWNYYQAATCCYAFLVDVDTGKYDNSKFGRLRQRFEDSRWFKRCWTLQELIAPEEVIFFDNEWQRVGSRNGLCGIISKATQIDIQILNTPRQRLSYFSIAKRMSWASHRKATRLEDEAYSLLGIFGVNMPMLYGEGRKAFRRLQEEIIRYSTDLSIFAW
ncbi:hypothetical protein BT63DRAFT_363851, partial [Microthyrium microscopicum]